jgi:guanyl-specific ribonuclease Sa
LIERDSTSSVALDETTFPVTTFVVTAVLAVAFAGWTGRDAAQVGTVTNRATHNAAISFVLISLSSHPSARDHPASTCSQR